MYDFLYRLVSSQPRIGEKAMTTQKFIRTIKWLTLSVGLMILAIGGLNFGISEVEARATKATMLINSITFAEVDGPRWIPTPDFQRANEITKISVEDFRAIEKSSKETGIPWDTLVALYFTESSSGRILGDKKPQEIIKGDKWVAFKEICQRANLRPDDLTVNHRKAMGPFQFQPTTWLEIVQEFADRHTLVNPWNVEDASIAAGCFLSKHGYDSDPLTALVIYKGGKGAIGSWMAEQQARQVLKYASQIRDSV